MLLKLAHLKKLLVTILYLRAIQIFHQLLNLFHKPKSLNNYKLNLNNTDNLRFHYSPASIKNITINEYEYHCSFLNIHHEFKEQINWKINSFGKLWNYNLQYASFLNQENLNLKSKVELISDLYHQLWEGMVLLEPYPASLRIMNVIRFLSTNEIPKDSKSQISVYLSSEINYLSKNLEYHLLGNHLLENAFALLMGGYFFKKNLWIEKSKKILHKELKEQILYDGAHFELSPMYHQIILFRLLEAYSYLPSEEPIKKLLDSCVLKMLSWLHSISFSNGSIPHFNDSTDGVSLSTNQLFEIAQIAGLFPNKEITLSASGYRKFIFDDFEFVMDVHGISPSYQPGHAHADTFSFCLNYNNQPIIVDAGTSTYEISVRRSWERSTNAHNTLEINGENSSEVWASFRVARRAKVKILEDKENIIFAVHDGYKRLNANVYRKVNYINNQFIIEDTVISKRKVDLPIIGRLHLDSNVSIQRKENNFIINECLCIAFADDVELNIESYELAKGFNLRVASSRISYKLQNNSTSFSIYKI
jgi:hypothetical protein